MMGLFGVTLLLLLLGGTFPVGGLRGGSIGQEPPEHFLFQGKVECHFQNGTQQVRFLDRYFWDRQETLRFDSDLGRFVALEELGRPDAERLNKDQAGLWSKANVDRFCQYNYKGADILSSRRTVQPRVKISPTNHFSSSGHNTLLACDVAKFFPSKIQIKWLKNGKELEDPVWTTGLIRNGDWSFQIQAMLETKPERGDVYACWVDHATFEEPVMVQWEAQSDAARSKLWTGFVGFVLGLVFVAAGLTLYVRSKKAKFVTQNVHVARKVSNMAEQP